MLPDSKLDLESITDPVELMLKSTGCYELHCKVQECIANSQDWRKCQNEVKEFQKCIESSKSKKSTNT